jgi:hypothetical protein
MNPATHRHGCHNRKPFVAVVSSISGYVPPGVPRPSWPNVMSMDCEYTKTKLGQADSSCAGCRWAAVISISTVDENVDALA